MSEGKPKRVPRRDQGEDEEFEAIIDDPNQSPIEFYEDEDGGDLGPAIARGESLREVLESYAEYKRLEGMYDDE